MSNWQERIKEAFNNRQDAEHRQIEDERWRQATVRQRAADQETERQRRLQEARNILESIGVREMLERVRQVWKMGHISVTEEGSTVSLEWRRRGYEWRGGNSTSYEYGGGGRHYKVNGIWRDVLEITLSQSLDTLSVCDAHHFVEEKKDWDGKHWVTDFPPAFYHTRDAKYVHFERGNFHKARVELERAVLGLVESRIKLHRLPLGLK